MPITRRQFLNKGATVAPTAVGMPLVIPPEVFAKPRPSDRIRLGFIGVGQQHTGIEEVIAYQIHS